MHGIARVEVLTFSNGGDRFTDGSHVSKLWRLKFDAGERPKEGRPSPQESAVGHRWHVVLWQAHVLDDLTEATCTAAEA